MTDENALIEAMARAIYDASDKAKTWEACRVACLQAATAAHNIAKAHCEALVEAERALLGKIVAHFGDRRDGPGHCHEQPGIWDSDNGEKAGQPCDWCQTWAAIRNRTTNQGE